ncbi:alpha-N-acetylgalactosaminide alpha-2,6-sialyltransferase 1-like, partial [Clarias magur]
YQSANIPLRKLGLFLRRDEGINISRTPSLNLSSGKPTEGTAELKPQTEITPIPILYKKNFTKLPKWDFEDLYIQSNEARRPVCSKSLQKSKDEEFQHAALWNIQLWLHKGHLNMSEWNRLAHFNNPFGFMEYNYTDIKTSVDLIPEPKHYQLLPVPNGSVDGCIRCAVVGASGILNGSRMGKEIDSHDYVFRVNGAVTKGFEEDVGNKTSVYVHTSFSLTSSLEILEKYGFKHIPRDEGIIYVMIPEGLRDFEWIEGLLEKKSVTTGFYAGYRPLTYYSNRFQEDTFYVLHPDFLRYVRNRFMPSEVQNDSFWHLYRPTNGAFTLFLALHTCDIVCPKSLQKSKDEEFQHAAMWNIQLWLHKGHLNMSEWNRLAHFNNPFGFMEYRYTDIKKSVDLIPKPKHYQLLPVPNGSVDGCIRCAVVGASGILNGSRMGKEIDSHDYVFRVNGAVTKGFEEDVGNKTSVYVHTSFALTQSFIILGKYGFKRILHDEGIIYVMIPEGLRDFEWIEGLLEKKRMINGSYKGYRPKTYYSNHFQEDKFYVLHPDFLRYTRNRFMPSKSLNSSFWHMYRPTNGAFTLFLALHTCDIVDVYGFITADHSKYPNYYFERSRKNIKKSVDLIPKPKYYQLLPVPNGSVDGCIRCAVVGTSGILNGSRMGKEIDSHDYVFRMNGAVTKGFEEDVGNKTSVYVHTSFALTESLLTLEKYGFKSIPDDEGIIYVMIPEGQRDFEWIEGILEKKRMTTGYYKGYSPWTYYSKRFQEDTFYVLHPDFLRYVRNRFMPSETLKDSFWHLYRPTNGAFTLFLALHTCDI